MLRARLRGVRLRIIRANNRLGIRLMSLIRRCRLFEDIFINL